MTPVAETILIAFGLIGTFFFGYSVGRATIAKELAALMASMFGGKKDDGKESN